MQQQEQLSPAEVFDRYFGTALFTPWARVLLEYAAPRPGERALDLACGTGSVARQVAPLIGEAGSVVGVDLNPGMLAVARARPAPAGAPIEWREGDMTQLDLPSNSFSLVLCQQGLQFVADRAAAAREMRRVLAAGGRAALNLWQALEQHPLYHALCEAEARYLGVPIADMALPWTLPDAEELRELLEQAGFERIEIVERSLDVTFPEPERFVRLTLFAAAAFLPEFDWEDEEWCAAFIENISREIEPTVERYRAGDRLIVPTFWNIAVAYAR